MRLIDADALMGVFRARMVERYDRGKCASDENCKTCEPGCFWRRAIPAAPTVDAVPVVHGRWIPKGYATFKNKFEEVQIPTFFKCSECGTVRTDKYKYCPNCGAKMDGGKDNGNDE